MVHAVIGQITVVYFAGLSQLESISSVLILKLLIWIFLPCSPNIPCGV